MRLKNYMILWKCFKVNTLDTGKMTLLWTISMAWSLTHKQMYCHLSHLFQFTVTANQLFNHVPLHWTYCMVNDKMSTQANVRVSKWLYITLLIWLQADKFTILTVPAILTSIYFIDFLIFGTFMKQECLALVSEKTGWLVYRKAWADAVLSISGLDG